MNLSDLNNICLLDQYIFVRRMFKPIWITFILFIRLASFNHPIKEIIAFIKSSKIKNVDLNTPHYTFKNYEKFKSELVKSNPHISIIIPTLNRYKYLYNALKDLEKQIYKNFEIIIVDQSDEFNRKYYDNFNLNIKVIHQKEKALWLARNTAIKESKGDYLLLFDDDSQVSSDWIIHHLKTIDFFNVDISAGVSLSKIGAPIPKHYSFFRWADQLDTGNTLLKKEVFYKCGLFDRKFEGMRMGDAEFGLRALLYNFKSISNPKAQRIHLKVETGGLRNMGYWDGMRPKKILSPRPVPSVLYFYRKYWGDKATIYSLIKTIPISLGPYKLKGRKSGYFLSFLILILFFPIIMSQIILSWTKSNKMLKANINIERI